MSQLLITMSWKSSSLSGMPPGARGHVELVGFERAHQVLFALRRDRAKPAARAGCAGSRHLRSALRPGRSAEILPASAMAPTELTLACSRRWLTPAASSTLAGADGLAFRRHLHGGVGGARRFQRDVDGEALAAEDLAGKRDGFQQQAGLGAARPAARYRWECRAAAPARWRAPRCPGSHCRRRSAAGAAPCRRAAPPRHRGWRLPDPCRARPRRRCGAVASRLLVCSSGAALRVARAKGMTRVQWRPRARSTSVGERRFASPGPRATRWPKCPPARPPRPWSGRP